MASQTTYAADLGKCYAKKDNYRAYKDGGLFAIYMVGKELIWNADSTDYKVGTKLEAVHVGYIRDIDNFESAVQDLKVEMHSMMASA